MSNKENHYLDFHLDAIDRAATKSKVEEALEKYRFMLLTQDLDKMPSVTQSFSIVPPSLTNKFHSSTEDVAIEKVDYERNRSDYIKRISFAVNRLNYKERAIVIRRYMLEDDVFDYQVYSELHMSERTYYRHKSKAFYKLAFSLGIEVYEEREVTGA